MAQFYIWLKNFRASSISVFPLFSDHDNQNLRQRTIKFELVGKILNPKKKKKNRTTTYTCAKLPMAGLVQKALNDGSNIAAHDDNLDSWQQRRMGT